MSFNWSPLYSNQEILEEPILLAAEVIHGFKRGSKELGIPTANLAMDQLGEKAESLNCGIYYGHSILEGVTYPSVLSVGWNPFYKNTKKSIEVHLITDSPLEDFYGKHLEVQIIGYLRAEVSFNNLDELISCIHYDIKMAKLKLSPKK